MDTSPQFLYIFSASIFALFMLAESLLPLRSPGDLGRRWTNNFSLAAISWYATSTAGAWFIIWIADSQPLERFVLLPSALRSQPLLGLLLLLAVTEFLSYWVHVMYHHVAALWPIHAVHHADTDIDVSTSYRHHPLEPLLAIPLVTPAVLLLGVGPESVVLYHILAITLTVFSHTNLRLPQQLDNLLSTVIITPGFHHLHHCSDPHYTNSNYGTLVPWYDYLFGTASKRPLAEQAEMRIGLEYWREPKDMRLDQQLLMPLRNPRPD